MNTKGRSLCAKCNILSLGTYLKTFNYYTYNKKVNQSVNNLYPSPTHVHYHYKIIFNFMLKIN